MKFRFAFAMNSRKGHQLRQFKINRRCPIWTAGAFAKFNWHFTVVGFIYIFFLIYIYIYRFHMSNHAKSSNAYKTAILPSGQRELCGRVYPLLSRRFFFTFLVCKSCRPSVSVFMMWALLLCFSVIVFGKNYRLRMMVFLTSRIDDGSINWSVAHFGGNEF